MPRYSEIRLTSFLELSRAITTLDPDEGIRVEGGLSEFENGGFIFVTKSSKKYCVNVCDRVLDKDSNLYVPGGHDEWHYFSKVEKVQKVLRRMARKPLRAWFY